MYIKDLTNGTVRKYGTDRHDSLVISEDGKTLSYENLQNGEGSLYGDYRFCDEEGKIPAETECNYGEDYFNIGGWEEPRFLAHSDGSIEQINEPKTGQACSIQISDNATNGDVIKTLFPFVTKHISHSENNIYIDSPIQVTVLAFDRYWWNAPYKGAEE